MTGDMYWPCGLAQALKSIPENRSNGPVVFFRGTKDLLSISLEALGSFPGCPHLILEAFHDPPLSLKGLLLLAHRGLEGVHLGFQTVPLVNQTCDPEGH